MSLRDELAGVLARDPRYSIHAYAFVFEALEYTKKLKKRAPGEGPDRAVAGPPEDTPRHRTRALRRRTAPDAGPLRTTGDGRARSVGHSRHLGPRRDRLQPDRLRRPGDDPLPTPGPTSIDVYDFEEALRRDFVLALDDVA